MLHITQTLLRSLEDLLATRLLWFDCLVIFAAFQQVSLYRPGWLGAHCLDQTSLAAILLFLLHLSILGL